MVNLDMWTATRMQHHHQLLWRAAIMAHCRWRGRRVAMRIAESAQLRYRTPRAPNRPRDRTLASRSAP